MIRTQETTPASWPRLVMCAMATNALVSTACTSPGTEPTTGTAEQAIVDGQIDENHTFSSVVHLAFGQDFSGACSGTMIAPNVLVSAAHCIGGPSSPGVPLRIHFDNQRDVGGAPKLQPMTFPFAGNTFLHPLHPNSNGPPTYDMTIVRLPFPRVVSLKYVKPLRPATANPLSQAATEAPACTPSLSDCQNALFGLDNRICNWAGQHAVVVGYGNTEINDAGLEVSGTSIPFGNPPPVLGIDIQSLEPEQPSLAYTNAGLLFGSGPVPTILHGDSGGPIIVGGTDIPVVNPNDPLFSEPTLVGVVSAASGCAWEAARLSAPNNVNFVAPFLDQDGDAVPDHKDPCVYSINNADDDDDGVGDDVCDNCPGVSNPDQADENQNGIGDACDACVLAPGASQDSDGDGAVDACDFCPCDPAITKASEDPDQDGVCGGCDASLAGPGSICPEMCANGPKDNCPKLNNPGQENCNSTSEDRQLAEILGDACDPVPCPRFTPLFANVTPSGPSTEEISKLQTLLFRPIGAHHVETSALAGLEVESDIATSPRFCLSVPSQNIDCFAPLAISDDWLGTSLTTGAIAGTRAQETLDHWWHRTTVDMYLPDMAQGVVEYKTGNLFPKPWSWIADFDYWRGTFWGAPWFPDPNVPQGLNPTYAKPTGRFWMHGHSTLGTPANAGAGVHHLAQNPAMPAFMLANHYRPLYPHTRYVTNTELPFIDIFWTHDCPRCPCPGCQFNPPTICSDCPPIFDLPGFEPGESQILVRQTVAGIPSYGVFTPQRRVAPLTGTLRPNLQTSLNADLRWVNQAEPSAMFGGGPGAPLAVGLSQDGVAVLDTVVLAGGQLLGEGDRVSTPRSLAAPELSAPQPGPREGFQAVYSRSLRRIFLIGGQDPVSQAPIGDLWQRPVDASTWTRIPTRGYTPERALAATFSYRDNRLWILDDRPGPGNSRRARLVRLDTQSGNVDIIGEWPRTNVARRFWLLLDQDSESVLLVATRSTGLGTIVARFNVGESGARLEGLWTAPLRTVAPPVVDMAGYTLLMAGPHGAPFSLRLDSFPPVHLPWKEVAQCF